jgi:co-chaperonin GroES (HSP10)
MRVIALSWAAVAQEEQEEEADATDWVLPSSSPEGVNKAEVVGVGAVGVRELEVQLEQELK